MRRLYLTACVFALSGCASTSFAPPAVDYYHKTTSNAPGACALSATTDEISQDVDGALNLVGNYLSSYRCAMRAAADGRQPWEILSFLSLVGSTAAVALGANKDVAILGGAGNSVFSGGKAYYAPQEQTTILSDAVDAIACIQAAAVGVDTFTIENTSEEQKNLRTRSGATVEVPVERIYFNMVGSSLVNVERAAAQRLARRGTFDPAGVAAEIESALKKIEEAKNAKEHPPTLRDQPGVSVALAGSVQTVQLDLALLQPELQKCVVRAKA